MKTYLNGSTFERLGTDIIGPLPKSNSGNRYIVVVTDYFTKWLESFAVESIEAKIVANVLVREFITRFGTCLELHSDQGSNY